MTKHKQPSKRSKASASDESLTKLPTTVAGRSELSRHQSTIAKLALNSMLTKTIDEPATLRQRPGYSGDSIVEIKKNLAKLFTSHTKNRSEIIESIISSGIIQSVFGRALNKDELMTSAENIYNKIQSKIHMDTDSSYNDGKNFVDGHEYLRDFLKQNSPMALRVKSEQTLISIMESKYMHHQEQLQNSYRSPMPKVSRSYIEQFLREAVSSQYEYPCRHSREGANGSQNHCLAFAHFGFTLREFILPGEGNDDGLPVDKPCVYCNRMLTAMRFFVGKQRSRGSEFCIHDHQVEVDLPGEYCSSRCFTQNSIKYNGMVGPVPNTTAADYAETSLIIGNTRIRSLVEAPSLFFVQ